MFHFPFSMKSNTDTRLEQVMRENPRFKLAFFVYCLKSGVWMAERFKTMKPVLSDQWIKMKELMSERITDDSVVNQWIDQNIIDVDDGFLTLSTLYNGDNIRSFKRAKRDDDVKHYKRNVFKESLEKHYKDRCEATAYVCKACSAEYTFYTTDSGEQRRIRTKETLVERFPNRPACCTVDSRTGNVIKTWLLRGVAFKENFVRSS